MLLEKNTATENEEKSSEYFAFEKLFNILKHSLKLEHFFCLQILTSIFFLPVVF